jgi:hypothetical protein
VGEGLALDQLTELSAEVVEAAGRRLLVSLGLPGFNKVDDLVNGGYLEGQRRLGRQLDGLGPVDPLNQPSSKPPGLALDVLIDAGRLLPA